MYKPTNPLPLYGLKYKDAKDLIRRQVQLEDTATPYVHEIPKLTMPPRPPFTLASLYVFGKNFISIMTP